MDLVRSKFRQKTQVKVRNYEIDWQGVVHNVNYLLYFDVGRVAYLEELGIRLDINTIRHESKVVIARNEIDYRSPAHFDETIDILTRIATIGNTSFTFEGILEEANTGRLIAENISVHVWLDHRTDRPMKVPEDFRKIVSRFEGKNLEIVPPGPSG